MSQTGYTPIQLYYSTTAAAVPVNTNLASGELAINITDGKLYYKDNTGTVKVIAGAGGAGVAGGSTTQVQYNSSGSLAGSANMTFDGTTLTAAGFSGPHNGTVGATTANTGAFTTLSASSTVTLSGGTANGVTYLNGSKVLTSGSALVFDGTQLGVGGSPTSLFSVGAGTASTYTDVNINGASTSNYGPYQSWASAGTKILEISSYGRVVGGTSTNSFITTVGALDLVFGTNRTEGMRLTSTGLGIGTSSPDQPLVVNKASGSNYLKISGANNAAYDLGLQFTDGTNTSYFGQLRGTLSGTAGALAWITGGAVRMVLDSSGNLGIGTTTPANPTGGKGFEISNASGASIRATNSATYLELQSGGSANYILSNGAYPLLFYTNGSERMRLDSAGNLGVNTTSPSYKIDAIGSTSSNSGIVTTLRLKNGGEQVNDGAKISFTSGTSTEGAGIGSGGQALNSADLRFYAGGNTERARIDASGNLLVGSTAQIWDEKGLITNSTNNVVLGVYGTNASYTSSAIRCQIETAAGTGWYFFEGRSSGGTFQYGIRGNGTVATSDERRKKNIEPARSYLEDICKIPVIKYNWKSDDDGAQKELGWIAQDVQKVFPSMVVTHHDGPNDDQEVLLLKKEVFLPMLMKCIQEQQAIIQQLQADVAALKGN